MCSSDLKHLGWLRRLCLQVRIAGQLGESLRASGLGSIAIDAGLDVPGLTVGQMENEIRVYQTIGTVLGEVFRAANANQVSLEGFTTSREIRRVLGPSPGCGTDDGKFYCIRESGETGQVGDPGGGHQAGQARQGGDGEIPPSCVT